MKAFGKFCKTNKLVVIFIIIVIVGFVYYVSIHVNPSTNNAFVTANVIPVSAYVPGPITNIYVKNNQYVKKGDKLLTILTSPYELKVSELEDKLKALNYSFESMKAVIEQDSYNLLIKKSEYENALYLSGQAAKLSVEDAVSVKHSEVLLKAKNESEYQYYIAKYQFQIDDLNLKKTESEIKSVTSALEIAQINLQETTIYAPSDGFISNMFTDIGRYAEVGESLFSFVNSNTWLVQANFKETELGNVKPGDKAEVTLWMYPWKIFEGTVVSVGNVNRQITSSVNSLQEIQNENQWFLLPQRFPVMIKIDNLSSEYTLYVGATANVKVDAKSTIFEQLLFEPFFW